MVEFECKEMHYYSIDSLRNKYLKKKEAFGEIAI